MLALQNAYLAALPAQVRERWKPQLSLLELLKGDPAPRGGPEGVILFPVDCVATMRARSADGSATFMRFAGNDFVIGIADLLNASKLRFEGTVCGAGHAFALPAQTFLQPFSDPSYTAALSAFTMAKIAEKAFAATHCATSHSARRRLGRMLLEADVSFGAGRDITLSHQELSDILAVRRETVTTILGEWCAEGFIGAKRGAVRVFEPSRLAAEACSCRAWVDHLRSEDLRVWRELAWVGG